MILLQMIAAPFVVAIAVQSILALWRYYEARSRVETRWRHEQFDRMTRGR